MHSNVRHAMVGTAFFSAFLACVGDSPDAGSIDDAVGDAALSSSSGNQPPLTGSSSGGSTSSSTSSSGSPLVDAGNDVAVPPDPRCTGPVQIQGAGDGTVACGLFASAGPTVALALGAYDLVGVAGGLGSGTCAEELWRASVEVVPDDDSFAMHLTAEVAGVTASYHFTATPGPDSTLFVQALCDSTLPFEVASDAGVGPQGVRFKIEKGAGEPRQLTFRMRSSSEPTRFREVRFTQR